MKKINYLKYHFYHLDRTHLYHPVYVVFFTQEDTTWRFFVSGSRVYNYDIFCNGFKTTSHRRMQLGYTWKFTKLKVIRFLGQVILTVLGTLFVANISWLILNFWSFFVANISWFTKGSFLCFHFKKVPRNRRVFEHFWSFYRCKH